MYTASLQIINVTIKDTALSGWGWESADWRGVRLSQKVVSWQGCYTASGDKVSVLDLLEAHGYLFIAITSIINVG